MEVKVKDVCIEMNINQYTVVGTYIDLDSNRLKKIVGRYLCTKSHVRISIFFFSNFDYNFDKINKEYNTIIILFDMIPI